MNQPHLNRREFIRNTSLLLGSLCITLPQLSGCGQAPERLAGEISLADFPADWQPLGESYLLAYPEEKELAVLWPRLQSTLEAVGMKTAESAEGTRFDLNLLNRAIELDYAGERVFRAQGWMLSQTEGRLATLAWLRA